MINLPSISLLCLPSYPLIQCPPFLSSSSIQRQWRGLCDECLHFCRISKAVFCRSVLFYYLPSALFLPTIYTNHNKNYFYFQKEEKDEYTLFNSASRLFKSSFHKEIGVRACSLFNSAVFSSRCRNKSSFFSFVKVHIVIPRR